MRESLTMPMSQRKEAAVTISQAVQSGAATNYWLELVPYPPGSARSLWLFVAGQWRRLDNPSASIQDAVQEAFCQCPARLEVMVWYDGEVIVGLVVHLV